MNYQKTPRSTSTAIEKACTTNYTNFSHLHEPFCESERHFSSHTGASFFLSLLVITEPNWGKLGATGDLEKI
jgi:hypothetical protein